MGTGNTLAMPTLQTLFAVHPRGYGEHISGSLIRRQTNGSSPWVRGTHRLSMVSRVRNRFIPVGTGNTNRGSHEMNGVPVHPRGYGEHKSEGLGLTIESGSSPWVRGTL